MYEERAFQLPTGVTLFTSVSVDPASRVLLVIHGGPDWDHTYLREPLSQLEGSFRVVLPDLCGCGRSTAGLADWQYAPDAVVGDLLALLDRLDTATAAVLGFSYGGLIAQHCPSTCAACPRFTSPLNGCGRTGAGSCPPRG